MLIPFFHSQLGFEGIKFTTKKNNLKSNLIEARKYLNKNFLKSSFVCLRSQLGFEGTQFKMEKKSEFTIETIFRIN